MSATPRNTYELALRERHAELGARFGTVGDWSVPLDYGDPPGEYRALRGSAAVLDRSTRSRFVVSGTDAHEVVAACFRGDTGQIEEGRAARAVALDGNGNVSDLVLVARTGGISYMIVGEPGRRAATLRMLQDAALPGYDVRIDDRTATTGLLGLAGPESARIAGEVFDKDLPARLPALHAALFEFHGFRTLALRTGDLGEDGFELVLAPAVMLHLVDELRESGIEPAGYLAQEMCRVEACIPAYDPDLATGLTPREAGLDVLLGIPGGRSTRTLAGVLLDGEPVSCGTTIRIDGADAGEVRSCVHSPALDATIALAVLDQQHALPGTRLQAADTSGTVVVKPFLRRRQ